MKKNLKPLTEEDKIKQVWKAVFGKTPYVDKVTDEDGQVHISINGTFDLRSEDGEVLIQTLKGKVRRIVKGWSSEVFISSYDNDTGHGGEEHVLGWDETLLQALSRIIRAKVADILEGEIWTISTYEDRVENERHRKELRLL
jgi:hypothetical protein